MLGQVHVFDLVALEEVPIMLVDVWIPSISAGKPDTIVFSSALVRRNGHILPVRGVFPVTPSPLSVVSSHIDEP